MDTPPPIPEAPLVPPFVPATPVLPVKKSAGPSLVLIVSGAITGLVLAIAGVSAVLLLPGKQNEEDVEVPAAVDSGPNAEEILNKEIAEQVAEESALKEQGKTLTNELEKLRADSVALKGEVDVLNIDLKTLTSDSQ